MSDFSNQEIVAMISELQDGTERDCLIASMLDYLLDEIDELNDIAEIRSKSAEILI